MHGGMGSVARQSGSNIAATAHAPIRLVDQIPIIANISAYRRMGDTLRLHACCSSSTFDKRVHASVQHDGMS